MEVDDPVALPSQTCGRRGALIYSTLPLRTTPVRQAYSSSSHRHPPHHCRLGACLRIVRAL